MSNLRHSLYEVGILRDIDMQFSHWLAQRFPDTPESVLTLAALVSQQSGEGHVCLHFAHLDMLTFAWPPELKADAKIWHKQLRPLLANPHAVWGDGRQPTPLVVDQERVYLYRLWVAETQVAERLLDRAQQRSEPADLRAFNLRLDALFSHTQEQPDWQRVAVATAVVQHLAIISGGPGTGKTTTVTRMLAMYLQHVLTVYPDARPRLLLAAPTGKAAARLSESIAQAKVHLPVPDVVKQLIPEHGVTLHRLLGARPRSVQYRYHHDNPLSVDLLVVDEASMIDLPLMDALLDALPVHARLVLIGDKQQLASVEAGSVLGDICALPDQTVRSVSMQSLLAETCQCPMQQGEQHHLADSVALLHTSYRFASNSGIGALARAVNTGDTAQAKAILQQNLSDLVWLDAVSDNRHLIQHMAQQYQPYLNALQHAVTPDEAHALFAQFQLLCGLRKGLFGVTELNTAFENYLESRGLKARDNRWYVGRPVIITRNDAALQLYNGDIGITLFDPQQQQLRVYFEQGGEIRSYSTSRVPQHETVFAMTVHKSQGSEFAAITLVLTDHARVISRELVYTGITRAKQHCHLYGRKAVLMAAIEQPTVRMSGLGERLWQ